MTLTLVYIYTIDSGNQHTHPQMIQLVCIGVHNTIQGRFSCKNLGQMHRGQLYETCEIICSAKIKINQVATWKPITPIKSKSIT